MTSAPAQSWAPTMENLHEQQAVHCNENLISVFPDKELRGLSPNFHLHVSVSNLYIPRMSPQYFPAAE
jgi:hypothetical protein